MAKKRFTIRLYYAHDLDLITFMLTHEFDIMKAIYVTLNAIVKGESFVVEIPPVRENVVSEKRRKYSRSLILDTEKDEKIIEFVSLIKPGFRNNFFKNVLRLYLCNPLSEDFLVNTTDMPKFYEKFKVFKKGKRTVKAGKTKSVKQKRVVESESRNTEQEEKRIVSKETEELRTENEELNSSEINDLFAEITGGAN